MKGRQVVLGWLGGREAAALIVDGRLEDLLIAADAAATPGAIYRGVVDRPVKGLGGAFVRLPDGSGFLRETEGLAPGRTVIVQVTGTAEPGKAVPLTTRLLLKGRLSIVTPGAPGLNISRRIRDDAVRTRLQAVAAAAMAGSAVGLIMRSAAAEASDEEIAEEVTGLRRIAEAVVADLSGPPELLLDAPGPHDTAWRDWSDPAPDAVDEGPGALADHGVEAMIAAVLSPSVPLAGGGQMMVEPTRALVAVDVNTGADTSPAAGLKANIAAVRDLPRQLRLRGLGGQVVIDFAPMPKRDRAAVEQQMRAAFRADGTETVLVGWTPLGNFELQRKRDRLPLASALEGLRL